jgi:hypothetical protein|nr:MAG TPA: hypothetical protein [Caudoviricetes sp.]
MKTKEFISKMNEIADAEIDSSNTVINIDFPAGETVGWVSIDDFGAVDTSGIAFHSMKNKEEVVKLIFEYALTHLDEREDEPKFRVRMLPGESNWEVYLNLGKRSKDLFLDEPDETDEVQTIFTKSEYDKLQQKYSEWLPKFDEKDPHFEFLEADK